MVLKKPLATPMQKGQSDDDGGLGRKSSMTQDEARYIEINNKSLNVTDSQNKRT
jgi:hypothetical protein